jgi:DNA-binding transcriptional regulator YhcF (GntR family)
VPERSQPARIGGREDSQWVKAAGGLADGIRTGRYAPGERLPTVADMAVAACVHPRVMTRALLRLRELGYVDYRSGYGYYVSDEPPGYFLRNRGAAFMRGAATT